MPSEPATSSHGCLLVVGGRPDTVRKAVGAGLDVVLLQHRDHITIETVKLARACIIADYTDWATVEPLVVGAKEAYGFTAAISLTEPGLEPASRVNDLFGFDGNPFQVSRLLRNKLAMRRHLAALGGAAAAISIAAREAVDVESLYAFGREHGYPFVVKPADLSASVGVHKVEQADQIPEVWSAVEALRSHADPRWGAFYAVGPHIAEEYLDGPEYSVEGFTFDGRHVIVAVTDKLVGEDGFIELGHAEPARINRRTREALVSCTKAFLDAIGQRQGASHTEIKLTSSGPKIVEGHNRIGGDRIVDLLELAYGIDFELLTVAWPFKLVDPLPDDPVPNRAAATRFFTSPPGTVMEVLGTADVSAHPAVFAVDVTVVPGDVIQHGSNLDRCGQVIVTGDDTESVVELCTELTAKIEIRLATPPAMPGASEEVRL